MVLSFSVAHPLILCIDDAEVALRVKKLLSRVSDTTC